MRFLFKIFLYLILSINLLSPTISYANNIFDELITPQAQTFLPVADAFKLDFDQQGEKLFINWEITPGYYLYNKKLKFIAKEANIQQPLLPKGDWIEDEFFGKTEVYFDNLNLVVNLSNIKENAIVKIRYQGCAEAGLCYPPETLTIPLSKLKTKDVTTNIPQIKINTENEPSLTEKLANQDFINNLVLFFFLGLALAFTPCVFPMFPILSSLIAGQAGNLSTKRAFALSFVYVQGMAVTYALLGLVVATLGGQVQAYLQHPYILIAFSLLFVVLALSMFGLFEIRLPSSWMSRLTQVSNQQKSGNYIGVFLMGVLSGLIASPCTTAPLSGVLLYVAQNGDYLVGGITLYVLSIGMGIPLLLLGTSGGKLLPKAGAWMDQVKTLFGFVMLVVPLILLERIMSYDIILTLGAILMIATATYLYHWNTQTKQEKGKTILWLGAFVMLFTALSILQNIYLEPKQQSLTIDKQLNTLNNTENSKFKQVTTLEQLQKEIILANQKNELVMIDLYADWCVACKEFEHYTFSDSKVIKAFNNYTLIQVDLSDPDDALLFMKHFNVFGLPSILFFDKQGQELTSERVTGFMDANNFAAHLEKLKQ
ncbi:protein-disulfide reductase DsbD [Pseudoalteromonas denitrificans]|uniref:Thiol:disulfide interchange protein DsbD n=1 Tax=Pseudoalteromonas denitrificans DSM 6059 TaxID=1123010 RepID=A0A1I1DXV0_9GAMM|nr:protein-disulfide reductase DsbD [Pseudoalteromonas denitrificans]SFB77828.1 Thiol:disulfide interchange protein DsbD [Pseudoalteromonas denitrificans DSM 6059]